MQGFFFLNDEDLEKNIFIWQNILDIKMSMVF